MYEQDLREQLCVIGRLMHDARYIDGKSGNISARLDGDHILTTPSGTAKGFMRPDELIVVDMDGKRVDVPTAANANLRPTSEVLMHIECYRQRQDVGGVVHAHPATAVALTVAGYDFARCIVPESVVLLGIPPVADYATPSSDEMRDAIAGLIREHDAILLSHHGSLTVASTPWDAYLLLETLEHTARILFMAEQLGGARPIAPEQVAKLVQMRERLGLRRPGDDVRFAQAVAAE